MRIPEIISYHPQIGVMGKDGQVAVIRVDLPDFAQHEEVLELMGQTLKVETAGEVVKAIEGGEYAERLEAVGCLNCSVEHAAALHSPLVDWDDKVV